MRAKHTAVLAAAIFTGLTAVATALPVGYFARFREQAAASVPTPASGFQNCYLKSSDHLMYCKDSSGTSTAVGSGGGGSTGNFSFSGNGVDLSGSAAMTLGGANSTSVNLKSGAATGSTAATIDTTGAWTTGALLDIKTNGSTVAKLSLTDSGDGFILTDRAGVVRFLLDVNGAQMGSSSTNIATNYNVAGGIEYVIATGIEYVMNVSHEFFPNVDATNALGKASKRWDVAYVGSGNASPTCDATTRGGYKVVFAASLSADTLKVCMKNAADSYSWQTVFTAL